MAQKEKFSEEEWDSVLAAPMLSGFAVTAADPGGLISAFQESAALARSLRDAAEQSGTLAAEIAESYRSSEGRSAAAEGVRSLASGKSPGEASQAAVEQIGTAFAVVQRVAPDQAPGFRDFLLDTARSTAEASSEGGFLGFGGETVSDAERKTLDDLTAALGG